MSFLATWKEPLQNRVLKLINKLLLFQYSERIFSAKKRAVTLTLVHNTQLIKLFLSSYYMTRNSSFSQRYKGINIDEILLFQYSEGIFSANKSALTLILVHNTQLIMFFLSSYKMSRNSYFSQRNKRMNIETIENG